MLKIVEVANVDGVVTTGGEIVDAIAADDTVEVVGVSVEGEEIVVDEDVGSDPVACVVEVAEVIGDCGIDGVEDAVSPR